MRITASSIRLSSAHVFEAQSSVKERLAVRVRPAGGGDSFHRSERAIDNDTERLVRLLRRYFERSAAGEDTGRLAAKIDRLVARLEAAKAEASADPKPAVRVDLGYRRTASYREAEATSFRAVGSVTTDDGRQIDFSQALDLARGYARTESISLRASVRVPLPAASDASTTPSPVPASAPTADPAPPEPTGRQALALAGGILGLDQNGDGSIDPESELIGGSGNGFAELSHYDQDGNGFIDEGDEVFGKLAVVNAGAAGIESTSLAERGVGAVYLGSVSTPFTVRDAGGQVSAQLARSGVYVNENGTTGIAQQVNVLA